MKFYNQKMTMLSAASIFLCSPEAIAQTLQSGAQSASDSGNFGDIVVTAQRREESVQNTSISITALSGDTLQERQITSIEGLVQSIPNVDFGTFGGSARIAIRGIGFDTINPGAEGRIAYHLDGVYISRPAAQIGTFFDVQRVEVLRGPQGTLYGRNATGGSINVISNQPTDIVEGYVRVGYGNYDYLSTEGAISGPLADGVRARIAFRTVDGDGYGVNLRSDNDIDNMRQRGVRGSLSFDLGSEAQLDLSADYYRENDRNYGNHYLGNGNDFIAPFGFSYGGTVPANPRDIDDEIDPRNHREFWGASGRIKVPLGDLTLSAITSYRDSRMKLRTELDVTSAALTLFDFTERAKQFSQEFQVSGDYSWGDFVAGAYYFDEKIFGGSEIPISGLIFGSSDPRLLEAYEAFGNTHTKAAAAFGQVNIRVTDTLTAIAGLRYGWEKKTIDDYGQFDVSRFYAPDNVPIPVVSRRDSVTDTAMTPKIGLEWRPVDNTMLYATASKGFKSGGFNLGDNLPPFKPESIWAYEAGIKTTFAAGRIRLNTSVFYYDYTNLQVSKVLGTSVTIVNAASSSLYGIEADLAVIPVDGLKLDFSGSLLHSEYKNFSTADPARPELITPENPTGTISLDGNQLTQAPKREFNAGIQYEIDFGEIKITPRGEVAYQARTFFTPFNLDRVSRAPNTKINAFITFKKGAWNARLYGRNLTNKRTIGNALIASEIVGYPVVGTFDPPRTYGLEVGLDF